MKCTRCEKDVVYYEPHHHIDGSYVCDDCYFRELGGMMEQHPPGIHPKYQKISNPVASKLKSIVAELETCWSFEDQDRINEQLVRLREVIAELQ